MMWVTMKLEVSTVATKMRTWLVPNDFWVPKEKWTALFALEDSDREYDEELISESSEITHIYFMEKGPK